MNGPIITVSVWHNVQMDDHGRSTGMLDGFRPGDDMVRVFAYDLPAETVKAVGFSGVLEGAFEMFNIGECETSTAYRERSLRSLSVGDMVAVGESGFACASTGWTEVGAGDFTPVHRTDIPGTWPLGRR